MNLKQQSEQLKLCKEQEAVAMSDKIKISDKIRITDEIAENVAVLAQLELSEAERQQAKKDMEEMLAYVACLEELDTADVMPMTGLFSNSNVFREDVVTNGDGSQAALANAPKSRDGSFLVPKTVG